VKNIALQLMLVTAGGRVVCRRCTALSTRTGEQCRRPALRNSKSAKCQFHGGRSTGPRTAAGKARIAAAKTKHGTETRGLRAARSAAGARLARLEDCLYLLGLAEAPRTRGRKTAGYVPVRSIEDIELMIREDAARAS
jgi:hypothetical protein